MSDVELRPEVRALLAETKDAYAPSATSRAQAHWALERRLAEPRRTGLFGAPRSIRFALAALVLALAGGAAAAVYLTVSAPEEHLAPSGAGSSITDAPSSAHRIGTVPPRPSEAPTVPSSDDARANGAQSERPDGSGATPEARTATAAAAQPRADAAKERSKRALASLEGEIELLRQVNALRESGQAARALRLLDEYERTNGPGSLSQERSAARTLSLCALGRNERSRTAAARFQAAYPKSPQLPRVRAACGLEP